VKDFADTSLAKALSDVLAEAKKDQEAAKKLQGDAAATLKHEHDANAALVSIRGLLAKKDFDGAVTAATAAVKDFADTSLAKAISDALAEAKKDQEAARKLQADAAGKLKHEHDANVALASIHALIARKDFDAAVTAATAAGKEFSDTSYAKALSDALAEAKKDQDAAALAKVRREQFLKFRQDGVAAMNKKDYATAIAAFDNALKLEDDAATRLQLEDAKKLAKSLVTPSPSPTPAGKIDAAHPNIAVAEFQLARGAARPLVAAKDVDDALLKKFPSDKYQAVSSATLGDILRKAGLDATKVAAQPSLLAGKKVQGLEYLVVGTVSTDAQGRTVLDAELIDAATGKAVQSAKATLRAAADLDTALADLAKTLAK
jgi:tetratricopeptide (TPR) repeat protein